jgi:hypothetical protein
MAAEITMSCCCSCEVGEISELEFDLVFQVCCRFGLREIALLFLVKKEGEKIVGLEEGEDFYSTTCSNLNHDDVMSGLA